MKREYAVNKRIKEFIVESDKNKSAIADKAGIDRGVFSRIVNMKRSVYAQEVLPICKAMGVSVEYLFEEGRDSA